MRLRLMLHLALFQEIRNLRLPFEQDGKSVSGRDCQMRCHDVTQVVVGGVESALTLLDQY